MTEEQVNARLAEFWRKSGAASGRAPTVHDTWNEQERVAELDGVTPLPTRQEVLEHFSWFFEEAG